MSDIAGRVKAMVAEHREVKEKRALPTLAWVV